MTAQGRATRMNMRDQCPPWVIFHVPHDSTLVPSEVRRQITLTDGELDEELIKMTDHLTLLLFASGAPEVSGHPSARQPIGGGRRAIRGRPARAHGRPWNGRRLFGDLKSETVAATATRWRTRRLDAGVLPSSSRPARSRSLGGHRPSRALPGDRLPQLSEPGATVRIRRPRCSETGYLHRH
jgi:hypothetical protein